jgi:hypothetical protein
VLALSLVAFGIGVAGTLSAARFSANFSADYAAGQSPLVFSSLHEAGVNTSRHAALVFFGFHPPREGEHIEFFQDIEVLTDGLKDVVLVHSVQELDLDA